MYNLEKRDLLNSPKHISMSTSAHPRGVAASEAGPGWMIPENWG